MSDDTLDTILYTAAALLALGSLYFMWKSDVRRWALLFTVAAAVALAALVTT